jgi:hypothetical protein
MNTEALLPVARALAESLRKVYTEVRQGEAPSEISWVKTPRFLASYFGYRAWGNLGELASGVVVQGDLTSVVHIVTVAYADRATGQELGDLLLLIPLTGQVLGAPKGSVKVEPNATFPKIIDPSKVYSGPFLVNFKWTTP